MTDQDPTKIDLWSDPLHQRLVGRTNHKSLNIDVPYMSHIADNLWNGGCERGLILPENIEYVLSLYQWEAYTINHPVKDVQTVLMYDARGEVDRAQIVELIEWVSDRRRDGEVLVHCQAGLNRSGMITAGVLMHDEGLTASEAIALLRERRSPASLCNQDFEDFLHTLEF